MKQFLPAIALVILASSCTVGKNYNPSKKFSPAELQEDYRIFRNTLEESHPSLYWYTPRDSVNYYFDKGAAMLKDSLPEFRFRNVLSYVVAHIRCGHTSVRASKEAIRYSEKTRSILFPLTIKAWEDTVVVTSNISRKDSVLMRGSLLRSIDGKPVQQVLDSLFQYLSADGYNTSHKYQVLSSGGNFRNIYGSVYGLKWKTPVEFIDTAGLAKTDTLNLYVPKTDSSHRRQPPMPRPSKREIKQEMLAAQRSLKIDTALHTAFMDLNTFTTKNRLRGFFRRSFRKIRRQHISNLVIDIRGNGGGSVVLSNLLTRYITERPFKIADSLYAVTNKSRYKKYQDNYLLNRLFFLFMVHKKNDGHYHFSYFENRYFPPKTRNHFNGTTYILTGGNTFSAAALFARALKGQKNVVIVGEETGGGAYGNTAWLIPDVTLPHTKVRFRLPLFRLVIDKNDQKGHGIFPDIESKPTVEAVRKNQDYKMDQVIRMIRDKNRLTSTTGISTPQPK